MPQSSNWHIARILIFGYVTVALLLVFTAWYGVTRIENDVSLHEDRTQLAFASVLRIDSFANDSAEEVFAYLLSGLEDELVDFRNANEDIAEEFSRFASIERHSSADHDEHLDLVPPTQEAWAAFVTEAEGLVAVYQNGGQITQENFLPVEQALDAFFLQFDVLKEEKAAHLQAAIRAKDESLKNSEWLIVVVGAVGVVSLLVISLILLRLINRYINQFQATDQEMKIRSAALDAVAVGVCFTDADEHKLIYVNDAFVEITGYTREEVLGRNCRFLQGPETDKKDIEDIRHALSAGRPVIKLLRNYRKNGEPFWNQMSISPVHNEDGKVTHFVGAATDVTERLSLESRLYKTQKMDAIGKLTGGIAHDFNNLLAVIMGNQELLSDLISDPEQEELIKNSIEATQRGAELSRNMLSFARRAPLQPTTVDLNQLVKNMKSWIGRTLPSNVEVETSLLAGLWPVKVDASSAESGLLNLILNARDAMPDGGKLTIETSNVRVDDDYLLDRGEEVVPGRYVLLAVSDTGEGIAQDKLATIFEPFFTTKPVGSGTGLGLSMVEGFMKQSGGTIRVYSELGVGTTFKLYFSAADREKSSNKQAAPQSDKDTHAGKATILLVEDNVEVLETTRAALNKAGYRVLTAESGDLAVDVFEQHPDIDMLLTDIVMPGELQGTTLAKKLRSQRPDLSVLFMSGYASEATVHGNGLRPEDIRLMKPVRREELLRAVKKALAS